MHEMKLYIAEATVPKGYPPATLLTSMSSVDKDGKGIRDEDDVENNEFHGLRQYPVPGHTAGVGGGQ